MLVLSRKNQEAVVVGGGDSFHRLLKVTVLDISNGRVKLGFEVDAAIPIYRLELWEQMFASGQFDSRAGSSDASPTSPG